MYIPRPFEETRVAVLHALMRERPLAALVTQTAAGLDANHLPLLLDPEPAPFGTLRGHVALVNRLWDEFDPATEALAIFGGPQAYITPSWYPSKHDSGRVVPTWNYVAVHARGELRIHCDPEWLRAHLQRLVAAHEVSFPQPWQLVDAPAEYIAGLLRAIVGIELPIRALTGKWKVSQNRPDADRAGIAAGLGALPSDEARAMAALVAEQHEK